MTGFPVDNLIGLGIMARQYGIHKTKAAPAYIFVGGFYRGFLHQTTPGLWRHVQRRYLPVRRHGSGRWYLRRDLTRRPAGLG